MSAMIGGLQRRLVAPRWARSADHRATARGGPRIGGGGDPCGDTRGGMRSACDRHQGARARRRSPAGAWHVDHGLGRQRVRAGARMLFRGEGIEPVVPGMCRSIPLVRRPISWQQGSSAWPRARAGSRGRPVRRRQARRTASPAPRGSCDGTCCDGQASARTPSGLFDVGNSDLTAMISPRPWARRSSAWGRGSTSREGREIYEDETMSREIAARKGSWGGWMATNGLIPDCGAGVGVMIQVSSCSRCAGHIEMLEVSVCSVARVGSAARALHGHVLGLFLAQGPSGISGRGGTRGGPLG